MVKDTCLGCPVAASPLLQRFALGSSCKLHPPRSLHKQQLNIQQKCNENKYGEQYKNIQYHAWMHRIFMMINRAGVGPQFPNFTSITIRSPGQPCFKINVQITFNLCLVRSAYAPKEEGITFPWGPVSYPTKIGFIQNHTNKIDFQNCFPVFPSWLGAGRETMRGDVVGWFPTGMGAPRRGAAQGPRTRDNRDQRPWQ
jgi:hypothetical protein